MRHFRGSKHTLIPPIFFQGVGTPLPPPPASTPLCYSASYRIALYECNLEALAEETQYRCNLFRNSLSDNHC